MLERKQVAQCLNMGARLPAAAEQAEHFRMRRREIFRADRTHGGHAHLLNDPVRHDGDGLELLEIEQHHQATPEIAGRGRQNAPPLEAICVRKAGHVGCDTQRPHAAADATALLGLESVLEAGMRLRLDRHVRLRARAIDRLPIGELGENRLGG